MNQKQSSTNALNANTPGERTDEKFNRSIKYEKGAVIGFLYGLSCSAIVSATSPETKQASLEDIAMASLLFSTGSGMAFSVAGYVNQRVILPLRNYIDKKMDNLPKY